jgi:predicted NUDIX family NTP pyrophosphohydrolase
MVPRSLNISAGLMLYRNQGEKLEVFLAHPGGPFWVNRDEVAWTIPKGLVNEGESYFVAACREFEEETGIHPQGEFIDLGSIRQKAGKTVYAWALEGDADPNQTKSNLMKMEWPKGSGNWLTFPEVDRCAWFEVDKAIIYINPAQVELIYRLQLLLKK